jgi:hypothetical protein
MAAEVNLLERRLQTGTESAKKPDDQASVRARSARKATPLSSSGGIPIVVTTIIFTRTENVSSETPPLSWKMATLVSDAEQRDEQTRPAHFRHLRHGRLEPHRTEAAQRRGARTPPAASRPRECWLAHASPWGRADMGARDKHEHEHEHERSDAQLRARQRA